MNEFTCARDLSRAFFDARETIMHSNFEGNTWFETKMVI